MADFARWVTAAEKALGWPKGTFEGAYARNPAASLEIAFEDDPVAVQLDKLLADRARLVTNATDLFDELKNKTPLSTQRLKKWPKARTPSQSTSATGHASRCLSSGSR